MLGDEAQLLHKVLLPDALLDQLLQLLSSQIEGERETKSGGRQKGQGQAGGIQH